VLAQSGVRGDNVGIFDPTILDQWEVPFGDWVDQMVDWIDANLAWLLDAIRWPFAFLLENFVDNFLAELPWVWVVLATAVIGALIRTPKVGVAAGLAMAFCGLLGTAYWIETVRTVGMVLVAVVLCAIVGIPLGILCGRLDSVWNVVRPILDAMQVVHAFVYMLPVIFFWSIGVVPGTMVTMVFALPPLIRLTNLGIRQVPEDVVEASRAYGATEMRVLIDVQLPLARPALMTGLNQTLLMSIAMIGIAAIMGAGGLGRLVYKAVQNFDIAASAHPVWHSSWWQW
jgi:glycine betaine/proline transport system permease protein